jgi:hypothetical protein
VFCVLNQQPNAGGNARLKNTNTGRRRLYMYTHTHTTTQHFQSIRFNPSSLSLSLSLFRKEKSVEDLPRNKKRKKKGNPGVYIQDVLGGTNRSARDHSGGPTLIDLQHASIVGGFIVYLSGGSRRIFDGLSHTVLGLGFI